MAAIRPEYWARTQSSLNRLATKTVTFEKSPATCAESGVIQVLNCCSGSSCASWSIQACHRLSPAPAPTPAARLLFCPSLILGSRLCGYCRFRKAADSRLRASCPQRPFGDEVPTEREDSGFDKAG